MMNIISTSRSNLGVSLVNLLVGLTLGLIVSAGVIQGLFSLKQTHYSQVSKLELYESGRYALYILRKTIGNSGYLGCFNGAPVNVISSESQLQGLANYNQAVSGFEQLDDGWSPSLDGYLSALSINAGSDVLSISGMSTSSYNLQNSMTSSSDDLLVSSDLNATTGDVLLISDCESANLFRVSGLETNQAQDTLKFDATYNDMNQSKVNNAELSKSYGLSAKLAKFNHQSFFLTTNNQGNSALWMHWLDNGGQENSAELIEGVDAFKILFGYDDDGDGAANAYLSASQISNWANVVSLRLYLLLSTLDSYSDSPHTYSFMGSDFTVNDGKIRQEFSTTIKLNNVGIS
jgi:type IV pilus assembly protein PilW